MSWNRTCCMPTTSSSTSSSSSVTFSLPPLPRNYDIPPPPASSSSSSSFFFLPSSDYIDEQTTREREENNSLPPPPPLPPPLYNYHHLYSPIISSRVNTSADTCLCNTNNNYSSQISSYDPSSSFQSPFIYEQYLTSLKSEQSDHLPYLFDNIIYPQPCSPPSPTNDSITYYQLDHTNTTTTTINKFPQHSHIQIIQPITYQQLSLIEPPSSNIQQKLPIVKRFYYDSNMSNTTTTTIMTTTPIITTSNENDHLNIPYGRLESTYFGTYDIWQEKTIIGRKSHRCKVDVNIDSISVVSRIHFELLLINGNEFHLKCFSKNGIFVNNNYTKMSSTTILPKQCILRFPSTNLCISFSSLLNNNSINRTLVENISRHISNDSLQHQEHLLSTSIPIDITSSISHQSVPNITPQQQVIFVDINQSTQQIFNHESNNNLPSLTINIPNSLSLTDSSISAGSSTEHIKFQYESPTANNNSFLGSSISSCSTSPKNESNENQAIISLSSPIVQRFSSTNIDNIQQENDNNNNNNSKIITKPPFSYAQLIVQAILSAPDKQMTLSQIYNFISAQYSYYAANTRGWQNSIRHNLSLNRYFIRIARKENESGKGSFWRLDQTCEEKLIDHAFRHRKQRRNSINISNNSTIKHESEETQYCNDQTDFLLADLHTSNPSTPLSPMTSPLTTIISPIQQCENYKRKRNDDDDDDDDDLIDYEIEDLLNSLIESIDNNIILLFDKTIKRQKT
ncbi:unnamed protein product [Rotaria sp. Silwood1]|nr:unnamed protein product [Rotaria sp. Silwood1]CAF3530339.1 unnamed protein product [Rotaria sp. Silwood1]CAF4756395.1 unnamed protein product [Rotaria sp. Silwood1]